MDINKLNKDYTFQNFIEGKQNEFVKKVAIEATNNLGKKYNPLFIYGDIALGKTHLINAIGNKILQENPDIKILYITTSDFIKEFINEDNNNEIYKDIDVLLLEDLQFIAGKIFCQEEIFKVFCKMYEAKKQIVVTIDRHPKEILDIYNKIIDKFDLMLFAKVFIPDFETKLYYLENKIKDYKITIDEYLLITIAKKDSLTIRDIEGIVNQINAYEKLNKIPITMKVIEKILRDRE